MDYLADGIVAVVIDVVGLVDCEGANNVIAVVLFILNACFTSDHQTFCSRFKVRQIMVY